MSEVIFINLRPDDYNGAPRINDVCPPGEFPTVPEGSEIFDYWSSAGYNSWNNVGEDGFESEEDAFNQYGDSPMYYAVYLLVLKNEKVLTELDYGLSELWPDGLSITPDKMVEWFEEWDGVELALVIDQK